MIFNRKTPCYVLIFEQTEIIKKTLTFLCAQSAKLDIIVIENPSVNTPAIGKFISKLGKDRLIKRHYLMKKNITGNAFSQIIEEEMSRIRKSPYVILTDGDLTSDNKDWYGEQISILRNHADVFACGISLDLKNLPLKTFPDAKSWIPTDKAETEDYYETFTGVHLLMMRSKELLRFMEWKQEKELSFVDGNMHAFCYEVLNKKWSRTKKSQALHLTWDLYSDINHPYTKFKLSKSFKNTWYHQEISEYKLTNY